ncbi:sodium- and chloride-dependent betaine transporter-like [Penaeus monodon]|uniref:sodium- and chloride-dependent betaine transporter-like n=1 Tax=Penaeus monodon TaxID=6687 RepID=UPI0018A7E079|nr:sodium- and chloride-dependent betaine transporter-like [Penaeus monodon]
MVCKTPQTLGSKLLGQYEQRGTYRNQKEAFLAFLGYSVGLGNFWRFPFLCAKYNGVTFLIPYFVALVTMGLPLYFLEMALSQYVSIGPTRLFSFICPVFCGVGWAMVLVMMLETIYYNIGIAWTLFYAVASMQWNLPWCVSPALNATDCSQVENHYKAAALYFK